MDKKMAECQIDRIIFIHWYLKCLNQIKYKGKIKQTGLKRLSSGEKEDRRHGEILSFIRFIWNLDFKNCIYLNDGNIIRNN